MSTSAQKASSPGFTSWQARGAISLAIKRSVQTVMRRYVCLFICVWLITGRSAAQQLEPFGLEGKTVTAMHFYGGSLYAATENDGAYRRWLGEPDSGWVHLGVPAKNLTSIFAFHTVCPLICWKGILAGSILNPARSDTALIYFYQQRPDTCTKKGQWKPSDDGIDRTAIQQINALAGIDVCQPIGPTFVTAFAAAPASIWRSADRGESWKPVWQTPSTNILTLATKLRSNFSTLKNEVWAGGYRLDNLGARIPLILHSIDSGERWEDRSPAAVAESDECRALALHPADTSIVYAALQHAIIKSRDAGKSWTLTTLQNPNVAFKALAINPQRPNQIFAGGASDNDLFALYESRNGGANWIAIAPGNAIKGVSSLVFDLADSQHVYLATAGTGVYRYPRLTVNVTAAPRAPESFQISANFPNPFHLAANQPLLLRLSLPAADRVIVRIFNVMGQEMASWQMPLAAGEQSIALPLDRNKLSAGIYLIQAEWRGQRVTKKWMVVR
jgi:hypothetical protein